MFFPVSGTVQPGKTFPVERFYVVKGTAKEEILFHVFHDILNLALRFRICLPAKYRLEMLFLDKYMECFCQDVVAKFSRWMKILSWS